MKNVTNPVTKIFSHFIKKFFIFILAIICIQTVFAENNIKQLENDVVSMSDDSVKVNLLLVIGKHYCSIDNDKALMFLQEAFTVATTLNYMAGIGKALLWQGRVYYYKDDYPLSIKYLDKAKKKLETTNDLDALAFLYFAKAENSRICGNYIIALELFQEAIKAAERAGNTKLMS